MKNSSYNMSTLKHQLIDKKRSGEKEVIWRLNKEQREYLETLGYNPVPWLYRITTRQFVNPSNSKSKLIKDIHYARKRGCIELYKHLTSHDRELLMEYGIHCSVHKYKIVL